MNKSTNNGSPFIIGRDSNTGRRRKHNEDRYKVFNTTLLSPNNSAVRVPALVAVVADGVGGAVGGQEASRIAVERIEQSLSGRFLKPPVSRWLEQAIQQANQAIHQHISQNPQLKDMSSTVVVALITHNRLYVSHAGDSRAYLIRGNQIQQLTVDHTWVQEAIEAGRLTPQEAKQHPNRNVIKRYLGTNERLIVDHEIIDPAAAKNPTGHPETRPSLELIAGDVVMLCSDGLSDLVTEQNMLAVLKKHPDAPQAAVDELIKLANTKGGTDNITAVAVALRKNQKSKKKKSHPGLVGSSRKQTKKAAGSVVKSRVIPALLLVILLLLAVVAFLWLRSDEAGESGVAAIAETASALAPSENTPAAQEAVPAVENTPAPDLEPNPATTTPITPIAPTSNAASPQSTPVSTFTPAPTSTRLPTPTPVPNTQSAVVTLLEPPHGAAVQAIPVRFSVQVNGKQESDILELRMWKTRLDQQRTATTQWRSVGADRYEAEVERLPEGFTVGQNYSWTVILIGDDGKLRDAKAPKRKIRWNPPTGYHRDIDITLLEPAVNSPIKNSSLEFKVKVSGMQEGDTLQLWMGSNRSHLQPVEADWFPMAGPTEMVAKLTQAPKGYGKQYYWTVTLVDAPRTPLPVPNAIPFWWDE